MVSVDSVYQKVLMLSNKEQRGYVTPQEFNLLADKAQGEIFESYFHDYKTALVKTKNNSVFADELEMLSEKLQVFRSQSVGTELNIGDSGLASNSINFGALSIPIYKLDTVIINYSDGTKAEMVELTRRENFYAERNLLTKATTTRPTFVREGGKIIRFFPTPEDVEATLSFYYWRRPSKPRWNYVIVAGKPLYNNATSSNFEIHISEEERLVGRILALAGISIEDPQLTNVAMQDLANTKASQND